MAYIQVVIFYFLVMQHCPFACCKILNFVLCGILCNDVLFDISANISVSSTAVTEIIIHTFWRSLMVGLATNLIWVFLFLLHALCQMLLQLLR